MDFISWSSLNFIEKLSRKYKDHILTLHSASPKVTLLWTSWIGTFVITDELILIHYYYLKSSIYIRVPYVVQYCRFLQMYDDVIYHYNTICSLMQNNFTALVLPCVPQSSLQPLATTDILTVSIICVFQDVIYLGL